MTYGEFIDNANAYALKNADEQREGQAFYNYLSIARPDIASQLVGTDLDPFYHDYVSMEVWNFVKNAWVVE
jgi:hypothetical protein